MSSVALSAADRAALDELVSDLRRVFDARLQSVVAYALDTRDDAGDERALHTLVLAERVLFDDFAACVAHAVGWTRRGLATPLILSRDEFLRTLDVFPIEYGAILDSHIVLFGSTPFDGCLVNDADLRRAVELQAKSHLIHLREGFLETGGNAAAVGRLITASAPAYRALIENLGRLDPEFADEQEESARLLRELSTGSTIADPTALLKRYIADVERIWQLVDAWR